MELRVHGVGGTTPGSMLEPASRRPVVASRSDGAARSAVFRSQGFRGVFAYHWAPLTSGSRWFALWPLLLPFTLSNVAGFMLTSETRRRAILFRAASVVQALALTATAVWWAWAASLLVLHGVDLPTWIPGNAGRTSWAALFLGVAAMAVLVLAATYSADGFERFRRPSWKDTRGGWPWGAKSFTDLDDPQFYDNAEAHATRWKVHIVTAIVAAVGAALWVDAGDGGFADPTRELGWLTLAGVLAAAGAALLMTLSNVGGGSHDAADPIWRLLGPATTITASALLGGLVLSACLWRVSIADLPNGPLVVAYEAYGWAVGFTIAAAAACITWRLATPSPGESVLKPAPPLPTIAGRLWARLAPSLSHMNIVIATFAFTFLGAITISIIRNRHDLDGYRLTDSAPVTLARWTFVALLGFLFVNVIRSKADPKSLRRVGTIWDILTFWPRTFHPFAVRCYAERAVPELQELVDQADQDAATVVVGHSQGSVLAYAALRPFLVSGAAPRVADQCALVTVGSPLRSLYSRAFPRYFNPEQFRAVRTALDDRWTNLFRFTDYVGRAVFASDSDAAAAAVPGADHWLADPSVAGAPVSMHNHYWNDAAVREQVEAYTGIEKEQAK